MPLLKSINQLLFWHARPKLQHLLLLGLVLLSGCSSTPVATVEPFRTALKDVCVSREDHLTEGTAQRIEANNLALRKMLDRPSQCPKPQGRAGGRLPAGQSPAPAKEEPKTS